MAMYYNTPAPTIPVKLGQHDPWQRQLNGPQPPSPAYPVYTNGIHNHHHPQPPQQHGHQHSLSIPTTFASQQDNLVLRPATPGAAAAAAAAQQALGSPHWQQQMMKAEVRFEC
jgi:CCR4-NOT transcription complex subunit 6